MRRSWSHTQESPGLLMPLQNWFLWWRQCGQWVQLRSLQTACSQWAQAGSHTLGWPALITYFSSSVDAVIGARCDFRHRSPPLMSLPHTALLCSHFGTSQFLKYSFLLLMLEHCDTSCSWSMWSWLFPSSIVPTCTAYTLSLCRWEKKGDGRGSVTLAVSLA